jgi:Domain of unknown function (DUF5659)
MKKEKHFKTASFPLSTYLYSKNQQFVAIEPADAFGRKAFVFLKTDDLDELVKKYKFGNRRDPDLHVGVHAYEQARRELLDRLNDR